MSTMQECIVQLINSVRFAVSQGFCTRLVTSEFVEATANKFVSQLGQTDFASNNLIAIKYEAITDIKDKINAMPSLIYDQAIITSAEPLLSLASKLFEQHTRDKVATLLEFLKLEFIKPLQLQVEMQNKIYF